MNLVEMKETVDMLYDEWDLGKTPSHSKGKGCAWIYLFAILEETEKMVIEKDNGKVIGICGYTKWNSNKHIIRKKFFHILKTIFIYSPLVKDKKAIYKYYNDYDYTPEELNDYFDGEISILILNSGYRGRGIGKKMLLKIFEYAKNDNMKNIQILTDESCNFKFYEACGCKKVYEKVISNGEPDKYGNISREMGYIYEKRFEEKSKDLNKKLQNEVNN